MVSLATETDRTLFFDFLPLDLGSIKGFATKFQLYTVPGQVYYNATRKLVLRGVDGVVFVVDSQADKLQENLESFQNLQENLREYGHSIETIPVVLQFNKRDLPNIYPVDQLNSLVNKHGMPYYEAVAATGVGVFTTLKGIGKAVIDKFNAKYSGFQGSRRPAGSPASAPGTVPPTPQRAPAPQAPASGGMMGPGSGGMGGFGKAPEAPRPQPAPLSQAPGPQGSGLGPFQTPSANPYQSGAPAGGFGNAPAPFGNNPGMKPGNPPGQFVPPTGGPKPFSGFGAPAAPAAPAPAPGLGAMPSFGTGNSQQGSNAGSFSGAPMAPVGGNHPPSPFGAPFGGPGAGMPPSPPPNSGFSNMGAPNLGQQQPAPQPQRPPFGGGQAPNIPVAPQLETFGGPGRGPMNAPPAGGLQGVPGNPFGGAPQAPSPFGNPAQPQTSPFGGGPTLGGGFGGPAKAPPGPSPFGGQPMGPGPGPSPFGNPAAPPPFAGQPAMPGGFGNPGGPRPFPAQGGSLGGLPPQAPAPPFGNVQPGPMPGNPPQFGGGQQNPYPTQNHPNPAGFGGPSPMPGPPAFGAPQGGMPSPGPAFGNTAPNSMTPMPPVGDIGGSGADNHSGIVSTYEDMQRDDSFKTRKLPLPGEKKKGFFDGLFKKDK